MLLWKSCYFVHDSLMNRKFKRTAFMRDFAPYCLFILFNKRVQIIFCLLHIIFTWIWSLGIGRISFFAFHISIKLSKMCVFLSETEYVDGTAVPEQHTSFSHLDACAFITLSLTAILTGTHKNIWIETWMSHLLSNLYWMIFRYNTLMGVSSNMGTFDPDDLN